MGNKLAALLLASVILGALLGVLWSAQTGNTPVSQNTVTTSVSNNTQYVNQTETADLNGILNTIVNFITSLLNQIVNLFGTAAKAK